MQLALLSMSSRSSVEILSKVGNRLYAGLLVLAIGVICIVIGNLYQSNTWIGIGSSLLAGAIASLVLTLNRYLEDQRLSHTINNIIGSIEALGPSIADLTKLTIVSHKAEARCILEPTPRKQFERIVGALMRTRVKIHIDAMGLTLEKFHKEQLERLNTHKDVIVRLIVQSPDDPIFTQLAKQEKRDPVQEAADSKSFTEYVLTQNITHQGNSGNHADIQIRWFEGSPSVTMLRINDVIFVRPRFLGDTSEVTVFYEKYSRPNDGRVWEAYSQYFNTAWEVSKLPVKENPLEHR